MGTPWNRRCRGFKQLTVVITRSSRTRHYRWLKKRSFGTATKRNSSISILINERRVCASLFLDVQRFPFRIAGSPFLILTIRSRLDVRSLSIFRTTPTRPKCMFIIFRLLLQSFDSNAPLVIVCGSRIFRHEYGT